MQKHQHRPQQPKLFEGLRAGDLQGMVSHRFTIDQFTSKMGNDEEIIVVAFTVKEKEPAIDLMEFIEKGYIDVLDADMSTGEESDGQYKVFVEIERNDKAPETLADILRGMSQLCGQETWHFKYFKDVKGYDFTPEAMAENVPLSEESYKEKSKDQKSSDVSDVLNQGTAVVADIDESNNLTFTKPYAGDLTVKLESVGQYADLKHYLQGKIHLDEASNSQVLFLEKYLGNYEIHKIENKFLIRNGEKALIISKDKW